MKAQVLQYTVKDISGPMKDEQRECCMHAECMTELIIECDGDRQAIPIGLAPKGYRCDSCGKK